MLQGCPPASWNMVVPLLYLPCSTTSRFFQHICLFGCTRSLVAACGVFFTCGMWDLQLQHVNSWLLYVGSSSLTRNQTRAPCIWEQGVLAIGPPGKSVQSPVLKLLWHPQSVQAAATMGLGTYLHARMLVLFCDWLLSVLATKT